MKTKKTWSVEFYDVEHAPYPSIHTYVNATEEETIQEIFEGLREMYPTCFIVETDTMTFPSKRDRWERYFAAYADTELELSKVAEVRVTLNIRETTETKLCRLFDSLGF